MALRHFITQVWRNRCLRIGGDANSIFCKYAIEEENGARYYHRKTRNIKEQHKSDLKSPRRKCGFLPSMAGKRRQMLVAEGIFRRIDDCNFNELMFDESYKFSDEPALSHEEMVAEHERWMVRYNRVYKDEREKAMRFEIFREAFEFIQRFNKLKGLNLGVCMKADLTPREVYSEGPHLYECGY